MTPRHAPRNGPGSREAVKLGKIKVRDGVLSTRKMRARKKKPLPPGGGRGSSFRLELNPLQIWNLIPSRKTNGFMISLGLPDVAPGFVQL